MNSTAPPGSSRAIKPAWLVPLTPNQLTCMRILLAPFLVGTFYVESDWARWTAVALFALAGATDFLDGYVARKWDQSSILGGMLDPIADKLVVSAALLMLVDRGVVGGASTLAAVVILCREILVSGLREYLVTLQVRMPTTTLSKWKTATQMTAIAMLLSVPAGAALLPGVAALGLGLLWLAAALTLYTGYHYVRFSMRRMAAVPEGGGLDSRSPDREDRPEKASPP